jgi:biotin transport system permease protein
MIGAPLSKRTWLHKLPAGFKLLFIAGATVVFFWVEDPLVLLASLVLVLLVYLALGREAVLRLKLFRLMLPILAIVGAFQFLASGPAEAIASVSRLALMVLLADLVSMTTPMMAMMDAFLPVLRPLRHAGLDPSQLALAFALVIRFVPVLLDDWLRRREAWRARGGSYGSWRLIAPWIAGLLRIADRIAEALDARGFRPK